MSERFERLENSLLGISNINNFRSVHHHPSHVAQQIRREKLRVPLPSHHMQDFGNHLLPRYSNQGDFVRNCINNTSNNCDSPLYGPTPLFSSEMLNYSSNHGHLLLAHKQDVVLQQESNNNRTGHESGKKTPVGPVTVPEVNTNTTNVSHIVPTNLRFHQSQQQNSDWMLNFGGVCNENPNLIGGETLPRTTKQTELFSVAPIYIKSSDAITVDGSGSGDNEYQDVQSPLTGKNRCSDISNQDCQKSYGEINFSRSPMFYQTNLQETVTSSSTTTLGTQGFHQMDSGVHQVQQQQQQKIRETGHGSWVDDGENEPLLLPSHGIQNSHSSQLMEEEEAEGSTHCWNATQNEGNLESVVGESITNQGLSLSLSSYPIMASEVHASDQFGSENMQTRPVMCSDSQDHNQGSGNSVEGINGGFSAGYPRHCTGPLGPFTGYATILKNSKFLKPAQQLLEEFCSVTGSKIMKSCEVVDNSVLSDALNSDHGDVGCSRDGNSGGSSSFFSSCNATADGSRPCQSYLPEFQQKKAKLMYMLEEVCRRYKQYHQQMQMVVSSFETVGGLDAATPYTSLALKTISKHFRSLKNTIADQLSLMTKVLGEDSSSPTSGPNSNKGNTTLPRLRFINQSLGKQGAPGNSLGFLEPQQQVWRPQRGLPERSVAVLKAWLFEHFLHPYPTDTDKHMLASQTGLTRNQVSNWFINARVRVWKPMVEEMHMLETKGTSEMDLNSGKRNQKPGGDISGPNIIDHSSNMLMVNAMSEKVPECSTTGLTSNPEVGQSSEHWHQEKRSRMECQIQPGVHDGGLMAFVPYNPQRALEGGGIGSVSLTLGLRHSTGNVHQQQQQHQDHQLSRHYGGQMLHDFVD